MKSTLISNEIAEPYAQALMSVAQSSNLTEQIGEDVRSLLNLLKESADMRQFITVPFVEAAKKKAVLRQVLGDQVQPFTLNFLMLLIDRGRISLIAEISQQFLSLLRDLNRTALAEVTSAVELNDEQKESIRQKVLSMAQAQQVELEVKIDPELLGGVIIKVGSQVIDASLRSQLRQIGVKLAGTG